MPRKVRHSSFPDRKVTDPENTSFADRSRIEHFAGLRLNSDPWFGVCSIKCEICVNCRSAGWRAASRGLSSRKGIDYEHDYEQDHEGASGLDQGGFAYPYSG